MNVLKELDGKDVHDYRGFIHSWTKEKQDQWYEVDLPWLVATYPDLEHDNFCVFLRHKERLSEGPEHFFITEDNKDPTRPSRLNLNQAIADGKVAPLPKDYIKKRALFWAGDSYLQSGECAIHFNWMNDNFRAELVKTILAAEKDIRHLKMLLTKY